MNALETPMEALAINYLSYGVLTAINNVWAWIAVFTAAVSFWKIRASGDVVSLISDQRLTFLPSPAERVSDSSTPLPSSAPCTAADEQPSTSETFAESSGFDGPTRGKFVVYYGGDNEVVEAERTGVEYEEVDVGEWRCVEEWESDFLRMKTGEMGWYRNLDLTVLDGSVVRLWDASRRSNGGDAAW